MFERILSVRFKENALFISQCQILMHDNQIVSFIIMKNAIHDNNQFR